MRRAAGAYHESERCGVTNLETWLTLVELLMDREGCLVLGSFEPYKVGGLVPDRNGFGVLYRVEGEATAKDARRQFHLIEEFAGCRLEEPVPPPHFYKTVMVCH